MIPDGIPDLSGLQQVHVTDMQVVLVAGTDVIDGGLSQGVSTMHLRVTNVVRGQAWLIPMTDQFARKLAGQLVAMADQHESNGDQGAKHDGID